MDVEPIAGGVLRMDLKGMEAAAACFCTLPDRVRKMPGSECLIPHRITVHKDASYTDGDEPEAREVSQALLRRLVGSINEARLATATHASFACVDGRQVHLDSPRSFGGDLVEMSHVLSFARQVLGADLTQDAVDTFLADWLSTRRGRGEHERFYFYTDLDAVSQLSQWLRDHKGLVGHQYIELTNVPDPLHRPVLEGLRVASNHGNVFLRMLLEFPDKFGANADAIHKLVRAYFNILWRRDKVSAQGMLHKRLQFVVAEGYHTERVFIDVRNSAYCDAEAIHSVLTLGQIEDMVPDATSAPEPAPRPPQPQETGARVLQRRVARAAADLRAQKEALADARSVNAPLHFVQVGEQVTAQARTEGRARTEGQADGAAPASFSLLQRPAPEALSPLPTRTALGVDTVAAGAVEDAIAAARAQDPSVSGTAAGASAFEGMNDAVTRAIAAADGYAPAAEAALAALNTDPSAEATAKVTAAVEAQSVSLDAEGQGGGQQQQEQQKEQQAAAAAEAAEAEEDPNVAFAANLAETLLKTGTAHEVLRQADQLYPWGTGEAGDRLVLDSGYRPQTGMQAFVFNSQAVVNLRRELLRKAVMSFKIGTYDNNWPQFQARTDANDKLFRRIVAGTLPQYVVFMT